MSTIIDGKNVKSNQQRLEELFCWAELAGNGKNLAVPVILNESTFNKVQIQISQLKKFGK